ncbi:MAG: response regulator [Opitutaceae bacterium]
MKVLTVEDDAVSHLVLEAALRALGHEIVAASDGAEAWRLLAGSPIPLVVSDWRMPGVDGLELCRRIRMRRGDYVYFILLTQQSATDENHQAALEAGVDDFLSKPFNVRDLKMRLHVADRILTFATQVRQLEAIVPICGYCKKVRSDQRYWQELESYIQTKTGSAFSHGICPDCYASRVMPMLRAAGLQDIPPAPGPS